MSYSLKYTINDDEWTFSVLSEKDYDKKHGKDSDGLADTEAKTVDFRESEFKLSLILHELTHVHFYYCFFERADLKVGQLEEIAAELMAFRGEKIGIQAKEIHEKLKGKQKRSR